jgi:hypothetical protein
MASSSVVVGAEEDGEGIVVGDHRARRRRLVEGRRQLASP